MRDAERTLHFGVLAQVLVDTEVRPHRCTTIKPGSRGSNHLLLRTRRPRKRNRRLPNLRSRQACVVAVGFQWLPSDSATLPTMLGQHAFADSRKMRYCPVLAEESPAGHFGPAAHAVS